jgi:hypothetical protein
MPDQHVFAAPQDIIVRLNEQDIPADRHAPQRDEEPMLFCPVCSTRLTPRKCKLLCEKCGYYMSCADYY